MNDYIDFANEIKAEIISTIEDAKIKNKRDIPLKVVPRRVAVPDRGVCPLASIYKVKMVGEDVEPDQPVLVLPRLLIVPIDFMDYSTVSLEDAETYIDDLLNKTINALQENSDLGGKAVGLKVRDIEWGDDNIDRLYYAFSQMTLQVEMAYISG